MNQYLKAFFHRGLVFGGFGPIVTGIVLAIIAWSGVSVSLSALEILVMVISTYLLAFVHAGASVFNQIEHWHISKSLACHFASLYTVYSLCYLVNAWIPFHLTAFLIFSGVFAVSYLIVWLAVYISIKRISEKLNKKIEQ
ncbi:MAG: DUF3021 domain-containing protein [Clostridia bacterium]|nr:DUF3021 domain-containing protein [Clostridia bacterium]